VAATATFSRRTGGGEVFRARGAAGVDQRRRVKEDEQLLLLVLYGTRFSLRPDLVPTTEVRGNIL